MDSTARVYRHSPVTRATHATFFFSFFALAVSGAQMYFKAHWIPFKVPVLHQYFGLAMLVSGVVYIASGMINGQLGKLLFTSGDIAGIWPMTAYYLRIRPSPPAYGDYNPLQKLAYTMVLFFIAPLMSPPDSHCGSTRRFSRTPPPFSGKRPRVSGISASR